MGSQTQTKPGWSRLDANPIIHRSPQPLLAVQIFLSCLHRIVSQQINYDGVTICDLPTFQEFAGVIQLFTALDFIIVDRKVTHTVTWKVRKNLGQPFEHTYVGFGGTPALKQLEDFRDSLRHYTLPPPY